MALSANEIIKNIETAQLKQDVTDFNVGDTIKVYAKIKEGNRERVQAFEGTVLKRQGGSNRETFTVRKNSNGVGVEKTWPLHSPTIEKIEVIRRGKVRRAKLNYLRDRVGKKAKVKELVKYYLQRQLETCPQIHFNLGVSYYEEKFLYRRIALRRRGQKSYYDKHNLSRHVSKRNSKIKRFLRSFWRWLLLVFIAMIVGYAFVTFGFQTVTVVGPSMNPTLSDSQVVLVNKIVYKVSDVKRYDVIAYSRVKGGAYYEIKRVVGLPEETVRILNGDIYINGERRSDVPFTMAIQISGIAEEEITLGENEYFVMGDNVNNSEDSRYTNVGNIAKTEITGKVVSILSPRSDKGKVK